MFRVSISAMLLLIFLFVPPVAYSAERSFISPIHIPSNSRKEFEVNAWKNGGKVKIEPELGVNYIDGDEPFYMTIELVSSRGQLLYLEFYDNDCSGYLSFELRIKKKKGFQFHYFEKVIPMGEVIYVSYQRRVKSSDSKYLVKIMGHTFESDWLPRPQELILETASDVLIVEGGAHVQKTSI